MTHQEALSELVAICLAVYVHIRDMTLQEASECLAIAGMANA